MREGRREGRGNAEAQSRREEKGEGGNAKAQSRREEKERGPAVACHGMGILVMTFHGRPARPASRGVLRQAGTPVPRRNAGGFPRDEDFSRP